jgi:hypothetical protein
VRCQVRSGTDSSCPRPASVEILGVPVCEQCAREQQAYLAIGESSRATCPTTIGLGWRPSSGEHWRRWTGR